MSQKQFLSESLDVSEATVDRDSGIIRNVRILGSRSPNNHGVKGVTEGTEYTRSAMESAARLYENNTVRINHPDRKKPNSERDVADTFGVLQENTVRDGKEGPETRGNLAYYKSHPMAERVLEDIERKLGRFGLSHNAYTSKASVKNKRYVVEEIAEVLSVDLVDRAATNKNLWESVESKVPTLREVIESQLPTYGDGKKKWVSWLFEGDAKMVDAPAGEGGDHQAAIDEGFANAIKGVAESYMSGGLDEEAACKKLKMLIKSHSKIKGSDDKATDEPGAEDKPAPDAKYESLERQNATLKLLMESGINKPSAVMLEALEGLKTDESRRAFINETKAIANPVKSSGVPKVAIVESKEPETKSPPTVEQFTAAIA